MVLRQLSTYLMFLYNMGLRQFAVIDMGPMGCLPTITVERSYAICNATSHNYIFLYYIFFYLILLRLVGSGGTDLKCQYLFIFC